MSKILTVTLNTSVDYFFKVNNLTLGKSLRSNYFKRFASGKGINVARTLETLSQKVFAIGITGNDSSKLFYDMNSTLLQTELIEVSGETRNNVTIIDTNNYDTIHVQSTGYSINSSLLLKINTMLKNNIESGDIVILSGSLPTGIPDSTYRDLVKFCKSLEAYVILDTSGTPLLLGIESYPDIIKPNIHELESCVGYRLKSAEDIINACIDISSHGVRTVIVSMGKDGVITYQKNNKYSYSANVKLGNHKTLYGNVGSGDALVAGFSYGINTNMNFIDSLKNGVACGAANLLSIGPGVCNKSDIRNLVSKVSISQVLI